MYDQLAFINIYNAYKTLYRVIIDLKYPLYQHHETITENGIQNQTLN